MTKKNYKKHVQFIGSRELIQLDQNPIRDQAILNLELWNNKIDSIEAEIQKFEDTEVKLFNDWLNLTIGKLQSEIMSFHEKYEKLGRFTNWFILTSEELKISLPHAYFLMLNEESLYQHGTDIEKKEIENIRIARDKKISKKIKSQSFDDFDEDFDDLDFDDKEFENKNKDKSTKQDFQNDENGHFQENRKKFKNEIHSIERMTDKQIIKKFKAVNLGVDFITEVALICIQCNRLDLIERYWGLTPQKVKTHVNAEFKRQLGVSLDIFIEEFKDRYIDSDQQIKDSEQLDFNFDLQEDLKNKKQDNIRPNPEVPKQIYRKIMMKIHPDKLSTEFVTANKIWLDHLWKKIQAAYDKADILSLQTLLLQITVKFKHYDELDLSELKLAAKHLESDFEQACQFHTNIIHHPAWGFSKLKSHKHLEKKVAEPYKYQLKEIKKDIKEIEKRHKFLNDMVETINASGGFGPIKSKKRRKKQQDEEWPY